ncbi:Acetyl-CoA synthetase (Acetate-CoA ligase) [Sinomonas atrocyanea]|uniref:Acetyl-CoA synthetase (Acetate-CoA ligase) n=1 Tax=Sinomonas atrocyanea TaxID=37927 RepID=A0A126ZYK4_9MICC|nr:AMP-binding protein [Sinomonas atrocyanea]AMM31644.1 Acetyl-CoA synthetase (Acetate-CoA ligase) [Sinomonas atrocyanea]GEB64204.1 acetyl-CoA synthetase [Sinomonas atrocyanea]GGG57197.1 acetyl-CoA synthetase [Sinomonas atrocyanea]
MPGPTAAPVDANTAEWALVEALAAEHPRSGRHNLYTESCGRWAADSTRTALTVRDESGTSENFTYTQLDGMSARLAGYLRSRGIGAGDTVAGILDRGLAPWLVAFAAWRLGAVYVPLFTGYGAAALADRLRLASARIVVCEPALQAALEDELPGTEIIGSATATDGRPGRPSLGQALAHPPYRPIAATGPADTAVMMFTSGTTGTPKACTIPHAGWLATVPFARHVLGTRPDSAVLGLSDPGWSYGLLTTGSTIMALGHRVIVQTGRFDAARILYALAENGAVHVAGAPTAFRRLLDSIPDGPPLPGLLPATSGGEPLDPETARSWSELTGVPLRNGYGLTEVGMVLADPGEGDGRLEPIPGWEVRLADPGRTASEGRLLIRRPPHQLSDGYANATPAWARLWTEDGWLATEDVFRRDSDGKLTYRGRVDDVIVTSGYKISPVEVESVLRRHPGVRDAAAVPTPDGAGGSTVRAVVETMPGYAGSPELASNLKDLVRQEAGRHAYPRIIDFTDQLPRTESGKVRRQALGPEGPGSALPRSTAPAAGEAQWP